MGLRESGWHGEVWGFEALKMFLEKRILFLNYLDLFYLFTAPESSGRGILIFSYIKK